MLNSSASILNERNYTKSAFFQLQYSTNKSIGWARNFCCFRYLIPVELIQLKGLTNSNRLECKSFDNNECPSDSWISLVSIKHSNKNRWKWTSSLSALNKCALTEKLLLRSIIVELCCSACDVWTLSEANNWTPDAINAIVKKSDLKNLIGAEREFIQMKGLQK